MPYLLDSDWLIDFLEKDLLAQQLIRRLVPDGVHISIITYMEVYQGIARSPNTAALEATLDDLLEAVGLLTLTPEVARRCARLRETLRQQGRRVNSRALDLINAAIALEHGLILVTRNVSDFRDIPDLALHAPG